VDHDVIGLENGPVHRIVKVRVEHMAVRAPIAAEVQDDASMSRRGALQRGGQIRLGSFGRWINIAQRR
jgi:hypothetical protein